MPNNQWPEIIGPKDLSELTEGRIGRRMAYEIFAEPDFPRVVIGNKWFVKTEDFWAWWETKKGNVPSFDGTLTPKQAAAQLQEIIEESQDLDEKYKK
ncbi:MAG: hypothetical protein ACM3UZ_03840 [Acidobacteriota bacterium]